MGYASLRHQRTEPARIWNAVTAKEIVVLRGHEHCVMDASFSPDNSLVVTASWDETSRIWDAQTGRQISVRPGLGRVSSAVFSPDGAHLITASDYAARIWNLTTAAEIAVLRGHDKPVDSVAFSKDGSRIVTTSRDNTIRIWDAVTYKQVLMLPAHGIRDAKFDPDGTLIVTALNDKTARTWDVHFSTMSTQADHRNLHAAATRHDQVEP